MLRRFVRAYQRVQPLTIGELWAVAITLRVVLVENLRRLAERIVHDRAARQEADTVADRLLGLGGRSTEPAATVLRQFEGAPLAASFIVQLVQRLRDQDPMVMPTLRWIEKRLAAQGTVADEIVRVEHQRQAAMNVTVRNVITSMHVISAFDWAEFFESVSLVDAILWTDTGFAAPDFATRDRYRRAIEELSRCSPHEEREVARRAVFQAKQFQGEAQGRQRPSRGPPRRSRLLSDRQRACRLRAGARLSHADQNLASPRLCYSSDASLPWNDRDCQRCSSSVCFCSIPAQRKLESSVCF